MSLFCFLWLPLFYFFWRHVTESYAAAGGVWALLIGAIVSLVQFFLGSLMESGGFGLSRWASGCIEIVTLPALAPLLVYLILGSFKIITGVLDFANFALLWLIPGGVLRAVSWSHLNDPMLLVLVPLLWTAIAVGIPFFITLILNSRRWVIVPASLAILIIPFAASCSYWAFYSQKISLGFLSFFTAITPALVSMILSFTRSGERA